MISPKLLVFTVLVSALPVFAAQDAPPPNVDSLLNELTAIENKQKQIKSAAKSSILAQIQAAAASGQAAMAFYEQAIQEVRFRGRKDKVTAFLEWKKANNDLLHSKELQSALLFHLRYLMLALQRKDIAKPEALLPATMAYVNDLTKDYPAAPQEDTPNALTKGAHKPSPGDLAKTINEILNKPMGQVVIADWLQLGEWLPDEKNCEPQAGNVAGILEKNIRPIMRDSKSPQLLQTWDLQMKFEADSITNGRYAHKADIFNTVTRQKLLFQRAQDMIVLDQPNRAVAEMIALVKASPEHPDFQTWVTKIRELINRPATPAPSAAVPSASTSSAPAPAPAKTAPL